MEITGTIIKIEEKRTGTSERGAWASQSFVAEYFADPRDMYAKRLAFEVFGEDRLQKFNIQEGIEYSIKFDIDAREYKDRYYTQIRAYDVCVASKEPMQKLPDSAAVDGDAADDI